MSGCDFASRKQGWRDRLVARMRRLVGRPRPELPPGLAEALDDDIAAAVAEVHDRGRLIAVVTQRPDGTIRVVRDDAAIRAFFAVEKECAHG